MRRLKARLRVVRTSPCTTRRLHNKDMFCLSSTQGITTETPADANRAMSGQQSGLRRLLVGVTQVP